MYEFEKHPKLTQFVKEMANTGRAPQEWTSFIEILNEALRINDVSGNEKDSLQAEIDRLKKENESLKGQIELLIYSNQ